MSFSPTKLPNYISSKLKNVCLETFGNSELHFVNIKNSDKYIPNKCAYNAKKEADLVDGEVVFGWSIYIWDNVMIDFIGHAVVILNNNYYCVTPSKKNESKILFLPDKSITFNFDNLNSRLPSKEISISEKAEVQKLLNVRKEILNIKLKYPVTSETINLTLEDKERIIDLDKRERVLLDRVNYLCHPIKNDCPCGSKKQFRKCCRPKMKKAFGA